MLVIGFGYKARRGKDTAVQAIIEARGQALDMRRYAFADALRAEVDAAIREMWARLHPRFEYSAVMAAGDAMWGLCDWAGVQYEHDAPMDALYPWGKQRKLLQWWGTEYRRAQDADYWTKQLGERLNAEAPQVVLISDMRFENEVRFIEERRGFAVRVEREGYELPGAVAGHVSECELDGLSADRWSAALVGRDGDLEGLKRDAVALFDSLALQTA